MDESLLLLGSKLLLSVLSGVIIGLERQINNSQKKKRLGMRDFALVGILAFLATYLSQFNPIIWPLAFAGIVLLSMIFLIFESLQKLKNDEMAGFTTVLSFPLVFLISSLAVFHTDFWLISTILFLFLLILELKDKWHEWIAGIDKKEVIDLSLLIAIALSITPLIPHAASLNIPLWDFHLSSVHWEAISVSKFWKVILMVSIMSFCAHFITKYVKGRNALLLATFFGGLVSSLATILLFLKGSDGKEMNEAEQKNLYLAYLSAASGSVTKDILIMIPLIPAAFFDKILFPTVTILVMMIAFAIHSFASNTHEEAIKITERPLPLEFIGKFSSAFSIVFILMVAVLYYAQGVFILIAAFGSGMVSSAASLASLAQSYGNGGISDVVMGYGILAALLGSLFAKYFFIAKRIGFVKSWKFAVPLLMMLIVGSISFALVFFQ
jgi:uncharacterized membrane protein (DUF4010 family)